MIYGRCNENGVIGKCRRFSEEFPIFIDQSESIRAFRTEISRVISWPQSILEREFGFKRKFLIIAAYNKLFYLLQRQGKGQI